MKLWHYLLDIVIIGTYRFTELLYFTGVRMDSSICTSIKFRNKSSFVYNFNGDFFRKCSKKSL